MDLKKIAVLAAGIVAVGGLAVSGRGDAGAAQESQGNLDNHPLVGTWIVDTDIDNGADAPEVGIFTADGSVFGLGATRWVSGAWEAADDATGTVTMAGVFDENGGGYAVIRGAHEVDETGNVWTCACTFTVVAPDGTVLTSGMATAHAVRLPVETAESSGMPLAGFPAWSPAAPPAATPGA